MKNLKYISLLLLLGCQTIFGQNIYKQSQEGNNENLSVQEYTLTIKEEMVNKAGKEVKGNRTLGKSVGFSE